MRFTLAHAAPSPKVSTTTHQGGGSAAIPLRVSKSTKIRQECLWPCAPNGATLSTSNRRHQRWTTRHPIRFQECADRRPLLQQSCSDLRFPGPPADHPMRRPRCPRVDGSRSHGCHGPRCRLLQLRSPTHPFDHHDHQTLTLLDGRRMVGALDPRARSATITHPGPMGLRRISTNRIRTSRHHDPPTHPSTTTSQHGRGRSGGHGSAEARSCMDRAFLWRVDGQCMAKSCRSFPGPAANHYGT